jgi:endonuclease/exonuclease/phosphatase (EEP) superfamily protein YafD
VNFHGSAHQALAGVELEHLWKLALVWADDAPVILGGDLNLRSPLAHDNSIAHIAHHSVDHLFARELEQFTETYLLDRRVMLDEDHHVELSDHAPLMAVLCNKAGERLQSR